MTLQVDGHEVVVTRPGKVLFPDAGLTKLDLVNYYLTVASGALRGAGGRPCVLVRNEGIDEAVCSLDRLLELSARHERDGAGDAPWPPHYRKQAGEPRRAPPSTAPEAGKTATAKRAKAPLIEIGRADREEEVLAGLERWKARHPEAAAHLEPADVMVDKMRGRSSLWSRVRLNLQHVPARQRPKQEALDPDRK